MTRSEFSASVRLSKLRRVIGQAWSSNRFYQRMWRQAGLEPRPLHSLEQLGEYPIVTRHDLVRDQTAQPPLGENITGAGRIVRFLQSSGTTGAAVYWADTESSWRSVLHGSALAFQVAHVEPGMRILFAMPFGASSGPWILAEGADALGCPVLRPGEHVEDQLRWLRAFRPEVVVGKADQIRVLTAARARETGDASRSVRTIICTGPGGSGPDFRAATENAWGALCLERYGLTEAGSVAAECPAHPGGLHLLESEFVAEVLDPVTCQVVPIGAEGELVLTTLSRDYRPIIRYRTGDLVRLLRADRCRCGRDEWLIGQGIRRRG